jgi:hypothetical protein
MIEKAYLRFIVGEGNIEKLAAGHAADALTALMGSSDSPSPQTRPHCKLHFASNMGEPRERALARLLCDRLDTSAEPEADLLAVFNRKRAPDAWTAFIKTHDWWQFVCKRLGKSMEEIWSNQSVLRLEHLDEFLKDCPPHIAECVRSFARHPSRAWPKCAALLPGRRGTGIYSKEELQVYAQLRALLRRQNPIVAFTPSFAKARTGVESLHAYGVLGIRAQGGIRWVVLRNTWGDSTTWGDPPAGRTYDADWRSAGTSSATFERGRPHGLLQVLPLHSCGESIALQRVARRLDDGCGLTHRPDLWADSRAWPFDDDLQPVRLEGNERQGEACHVADLCSDRQPQAAALTVSTAGLIGSKGPLAEPWKL